MADGPQTDWWVQYPEVKSNPEKRDAGYLEGLMKSADKISGKDFAVIDVRGTDRVVGTGRYPHWH